MRSALIYTNNDKITPFLLTDVSDDDWLHNWQHILQVGRVVGHTSTACKQGVGEGRQAVEVVRG